MKRASALVLASLLLAGCSGLTSDAKPDQVFVLRPPAAATAPAAPTPAKLLVPRPVVQPGLDGPRIALVRPGNRLDYYAGGRWAGTLADVVHALAAQTLRASGAFAAVDSDRGIGGATAVLAITVRRFEADYAAGEEVAPRARVLLECTLTDRATRAVLANFDAQASVPAAANRMGAVVEALEQAANQALAQVVERSAAAVPGAR